MRLYRLIAEPQQIDISNLSVYALVHECEHMTASDLDSGVLALSVGSSCTFNSGTDREWKVIRIQ